jgi:aminomethyltransferase
MTAVQTLKKTALFDEHLRLKARMVPFAGYDMPVQYAGVMAEHLCVRKNVGLFDVSHMGICSIKGPAAANFINSLVTKEVASLPEQKAAYAILCNEDGHCLDDLIIYRENQNQFYIVFNASNKEKDFAHFQRQLTLSLEKYPQTELKALFDSHSLLALQGPLAHELLKKLGWKNAMLSPFSFVEGVLCGAPVKLAFTGYTGEIGCEIFVENTFAATLWKQILNVGAEFHIQPIGLGARDTLRTEMGYSLYGHELSESINPVEAGLSWAISFEKENFLGKAALVTAKQKPKRKMISLSYGSKQSPRPGMKVYSSEKLEVGEICSGTYAPSLGHVIAMALVTQESLAPYFVDIRGQHIEFNTVKRPFYNGSLKARKT